MELSELLRRRRMVRSFSDQAIDRDDLRQVLAAGCRAPSAGNTSGWAAVVMSEAQETEAFWQATTTEAWRLSSRRWPGLRKAPAVVAMFASPRLYQERYALPDKAAASDPEEETGHLGVSAANWPIPYWYVDSAFALMLMMLAANEVGLGVCVLGNFRGEDALREALGVPSDYRYVGALLLGRPEGEDPPSPSASFRRRRVDEVFFSGSWGTSYK